jgi:hypothetical protein
MSHHHHHHISKAAARRFAAFAKSNRPPRLPWRDCQAEAIAPDVLASILRDAINARIDQRALRAVIRREQRARRELRVRLP